MQFFRAVDRDADVFEEALGREIRERLGALLRDDRAVGRQVAAGVALLAEEIEHGHDVLAHEDLAAGQADLEAVLLRERLGAAPRRVSSCRHSPSMLSRSPT